MNISEITFIKQSIFESFIPSIDNEKLLKELNDFYLGIMASGESADMRFPDAGEESSKLKDEIGKRVDAIAGKQMKCREFWMFTMRNNGSVPRHNHKTNYQLHPEEYYSVTYYPLVPDDGANLNFIGNFCNTMESLISVKPQIGKLVIFNSFIDHYTDKNMSDSERVCISANYKPLEADKSLVSDWTKFAKPGVSEDSRLAKFS